MNGYAQGFNISDEEIAVFVRVARKAADTMNISISELFGKLESYARAMEEIGAFFDSIFNAIRETTDDLADIMQEISVLELPPSAVKDGKAMESAAPPRRAGTNAGISEIP